MKTVISFNTISFAATKHRNALSKLEFDLNASAVAVWVQLHDFPSAVQLASGLTAPANGSVPLKSWGFPTGGGQNLSKLFEPDEMAFANGIFAVVSTTEGTLTIGTGSNKFDMVSADMLEPDLSGTTVVQVGGATNSQVWSEATGATTNLKLLRAAVTNLEAGVRYLMLFATDTNANGSTPLMQWTLQATGNGSGLDTIGLNFGLGTNNSPLGRYMLSQDTSLVNHQGCTFALSSTTQVLTIVTGAGANFYSEYK